MRNWVTAAAMAVGAVGFFASCGTPSAPEARPEPAAEVVGRVATVNPVGAFVLIEKLGPWDVPDGTMLQVRTPGERAATLRPTGERQGRYVAADIVGGEPEPGDAVVFVRTGSAEMTPAAGGATADVTQAP